MTQDEFQQFWLLYHHRPLMKLLLNRDLVSALLNHFRLQTVPTMSQMNRMQQFTIINIMLKYFLDQANNMLHEWAVVVQEPKLLKFVLGHLVPVPSFESCKLCLPIVM
jgi:hypothetical protein